MERALLRYILWMAIAVAAGGCANIVPPSGGLKDIAPPRLRAVSPPDSQLQTRVQKVEFTFDEYVALTDATSQVQISPLLSIPLNVTSVNKRVIISIPDSLLLDETTYRITFGTAIRDIHEGNIYNASGYTFSTGTYFDSLSLRGTVHDAHTGLADTGALVMLYSAAEGDSAVVRHKPLYVVHTNEAGRFLFQGLPPRSFLLYALHDANSNLTFDGGKEWIGFADAPITPAAMKNPATTINLRTFPESLGDTSTTAAATGRTGLGGERSTAGIPADIAPGAYRVGADTSDLRKRTLDITRPLKITFGRRLSSDLNRAKIFLAKDSAGATMEVPLRITSDSSGLQYNLVTDWQEDAVYTLRLQKGFAKDSAGNDLLPGRYTFRTKRDEDYGKLRIHLPTKYFGRRHILQVANEHDTIYQQGITDTMVALLRIPPGTYSMRVIEDDNENGRWDAGDLFMRRQPEVVVPYTNSIMLKAGWEQQIDFETPRTRKLDEELKGKPGPGAKSGANPVTGDNTFDSR